MFQWFMLSRIVLQQEKPSSYLCGLKEQQVSSLQQPIHPAMSNYGAMSDCLENWGSECIQVVRARQTEELYYDMISASKFVFREWNDPEVQLEEEHGYMYHRDEHTGLFVPKWILCQKSNKDIVAVSGEAIGTEEVNGLLRARVAWPCPEEYYVMVEKCMEWKVGNSKSHEDRHLAEHHVACLTKLKLWDLDHAVPDCMNQTQSTWKRVEGWYGGFQMPCSSYPPMFATPSYILFMCPWNKWTILKASHFGTALVNHLMEAGRARALPMELNASFKHVIALNNDLGVFSLYKRYVDCLLSGEIIKMENVEWINKLFRTAHFDAILQFKMLAKINNMEICEASLQIFRESTEEQSKENTEEQGKEKHTEEEVEKKAAPKI